jgi:hypothetical protein
MRVLARVRRSIVGNDDFNVSGILFHDAPMRVVDETPHSWYVMTRMLTSG